MSARADRWWDDVTVGDQVEGYSMTLTWTSLALQVSGSQDWSAVHHDPEFATDSGHARPFFNTGWTAAALGRVLSDWAGNSGWLCSLEFRMRKMNVLGDTMHARGVVTGKRVDGDRQLVDLDVWLENEREGKTTPATATMMLPLKVGSGAVSSRADRSRGVGE